MCLFLHLIHYLASKSDLFLYLIHNVASKSDLFLYLIHNLASMIACVLRSLRHASRIAHSTLQCGRGGLEGQPLQLPFSQISNCQVHLNHAKRAKSQISTTLTDYQPAGSSAYESFGTLVLRNGVQVRYAEDDSLIQIQLGGEWMFPGKERFIQW